MNCSTIAVTSPTLARPNSPPKIEQISTFKMSIRSYNMGGRNLDPIGVTMVDIADQTQLLNTLLNTAESVPTAIS